MAKTTIDIVITVSVANIPPQYTGPTTINDLVVGAARQLQGFDTDPITWSMDASPLATISASGMLNPTAAGTGTIKVHLDDGKPA